MIQSVRQLEASAAAQGVGRYRKKKMQGKGIRNGNDGSNDAQRCRVLVPASGQRGALSEESAGSARQPIIGVVSVWVTAPTQGPRACGHSWAPGRTPMRQPWTHTEVHNNSLTDAHTHPHTQKNNGSLKGFVVLRKTITYWRTIFLFEAPLLVLWRTI